MFVIRTSPAGRIRDGPGDWADGRAAGRPGQAAAVKRESAWAGQPPAVSEVESASAVAGPLADRQGSPFDGFGRLTAGPAQGRVTCSEESVSSRHSVMAYGWSTPPKVA